MLTELKRAVGQENEGIDLQHEKVDHENEEITEDRTVDNNVTPKHNQICEYRTSENQVTVNDISFDNSNNRIKSTRTSWTTPEKSCRLQVRKYD